jgi:hypothetical protein
VVAEKECEIVHMEQTNERAVVVCFEVRQAPLAKTHAGGVVEEAGWFAIFKQDWLGDTGDRFLSLDTFELVFEKSRSLTPFRSIEVVVRFRASTYDKHPEGCFGVETDRYVSGMNCLTIGCFGTYLAGWVVILMLMLVDVKDMSFADSRSSVFIELRVKFVRGMKKKGLKA